MKNIAIILLLLAVFTSCRKSLDDVQPEQPVVTSMTNLKVSPDFDWKTTRDITIVVKGFVNGLVEVTSTEKVLYHRAFLHQGQPLTMKVTLPAAQNAIILHYMGQQVEMKLTGDQLSHEFKFQY
jgi:hypothetical protein